MTEKPRKDATLSYAERRPRRSQVRMQLLTLCGLVLVGLSCLKLAPELFRRCEILYSQHQLLNSLTPPNTPVYTASKIIRNGAAAIAETGVDNFTWSSLMVHCGAPSLMATAGVYAHEIRTPSGKVLLAVVQLHERSTQFGGDNRLELDLDSEVLEPGTLFRYPTIPIYNQPRFIFDEKLDDMAGQRLAIFGGQPDPMDPTHFTIDYTLGDKRHTLDACINDQDILTIYQRLESVTLQPPATAP
jgi:hypothetical protein